MRCFNYESQFDYNLIPAHMMDSLRRYIDDGVPTGDFLRAVLANDAANALGRADSNNMWILPVYFTFLYNEAPAGCWGSVEKVDAWLEMKARLRAKPEGETK